MGAQQSSGGAGAGATDDGAQLKTSYYELLGVERTATEDEIKKAYRRKALELHPDRNYGDTDRATALFADIQSAYQVLSDPQERAWYDAHEGDILRGGEGGAGDEHYEYNMRVTTADEISRMMGRFRGKVDFSDSPNGFFGFVRETFEQLAREEQHAANYEQVDVPDYPSFGHKDDKHEDVVRNFYAVWNGFATVKTFAWMDVYRPSEESDRRMRRLIVKENKKYRDEGIRQFNDAVRTLVAFVRKRDPRYTPNRQTDEEVAKAMRAANKAQAARARAANEAKMRDQADAVPAWAQAREPDELEEESEEEIEEVHFECVACHKTFKSEKQYDAHEKSKKHQKAVQALKRKMQKDNADLNLDEDVASSGTITPISADNEAGHALGSQDNSGEEDLVDMVEHVKVEDRAESTDDNKVESSTHDSRPQPTIERQSTNKAISKQYSDSTGDEDEDDDDNDEYASRSDIEARLASYRKSADIPNTDTHPSSTPEPETTTPGTGKKLGAAAKKRAKKAAAAKQAEAEVQPESKHKCMNCNAGFPSKTQLFDHLKAFPKHAAPVTVTKGVGGKKGKRS